MTLRPRISIFRLPLLMKELQEQSARRRTFVLRLAYAILLIFAVSLSNVGELSGLTMQGTASGANLGLGNRFFRSVINIQFLGVYLFLPAMVCGVLTVEKERNTLGLLLITRLGPWTIIFEKFASRIVPMLSFLLISLPLMSFMYSLGGMEPITLFQGVWFLLLSVLQIASLAVLASSFFSGTVGSFLGTYALIGLLIFGPVTLDYVLLHNSIFRMGVDFLSFFFLGTPSRGSNPAIFLFRELTFGMFFPPILLEMNVMAVSSSAGPMAGSSLKQPYWFAIISGIPTLLCTAASLALARYFLIRRAFVTSTNPILSLFKWLDRIFVAANNRFAAGVVLVKESQRLPNFDPVAWRETAKRSLGQFRYLVRVLVTLQFPTLLLIFLVATGREGTNARSGPVSALMFLLWVTAIVLISVTASSLIAGERSRQTLDVLLATPLSGRELILQKLRGVKRLMLVCAIPLLTCIAFQTWWKLELGHIATRYDTLVFGVVPNTRFDWIEYLVTSLLGTIVLFHLTMWVSFRIGMKMKSPSKAILTTLGTLVAWCALPAMLIFAFMVSMRSNQIPTAGSANSGELLLFLFSPAYLVAFAELQPLHTLGPIPYLPVLLNSLFYGTCWWLIRHQVLTHADDCLARMRSDRATHAA
jgi:hypothetical protein